MIKERTFGHRGRGECQAARHHSARCNSCADRIHGDGHQGIRNRRTPRRDNQPCEFIIEGGTERCGRTPRKTINSDAETAFGVKK